MYLWWLVGCIWYGTSVVLWSGSHALRREKHPSSPHGLNYERPSQLGDFLFQFESFDFGTVQPVLDGRRNAAFIVATQMDGASPASAETGRLEKGSGEAADGRAAFRRQLKADRARLVAAMREHARQSQAPTIAYLKSLGVERVESFWINNSLLVKDIDDATVTMLLHQHGAVEPQHHHKDDKDDGAAKQTAETTESPLQQPKTVRRNEIVATIPFPTDVRRVAMSELGSQTGDERGTAQLPWNLDIMDVATAWKTTRGEGVVVATIDTGVMMHKALVSKYRGFVGGDGMTEHFQHEYNWYDPAGNSPVPHDPHGHGTHTMGSMVGSMADATGETHWVGVAPDAKWISARGCDEFGCDEASLLAAAQWLMCPRDRNGENERCDLGADVVSNSWGGDGREAANWFEPAIAAWIAGGVVPVFAIGNDGPFCGTARAPGNHPNVIAVGAVTANYELAYYSSRGPAEREQKDGLVVFSVKPDVVAAGTDVVSTYNDGQFGTMSGTSMATPHVAGLVALLLSLDPTLDYAAIYRLITKSTVKDRLVEPTTGQPVCRKTDWKENPSYHFGFGLVNAANAIKMAGERKATLF